MSNMISPGVFLSEIDQSGIAQGVADIGAVIVAPFPKGVGFYPTSFTDIATLQSQFGIPDGTYYGPYTATQYLQEKGLVTVCRVGALTGYIQKYPFVLWAQSGEWTRAMDCGYLVSQSSTITLTTGQIPSGMYFQTAGITYPYPNGGIFSGSNTVYNVFGNFIGTGSFSGTGSLNGTGSINGGSITSGSNQNVNGTSTVTGSLTGTGSFSGIGILSGSYLNTGYFSGSIELNGVAASLTLQPNQGTAVAGISNTSGSIIYYGQTVAGEINGTILYTGALQIPSASFSSLSGSAASASILSNIIFNGLLSGSFDYIQGNDNPEYWPPTFYTSQIISANSANTSDDQTYGNPAVGAPDIWIMNGGIVTSTDHCGNISLIIPGNLSGSFGPLDGGFIANSGVYNTCSFQWTGAPVQKVLAVLGNTQWEQVDTSTLQVPGFNNSYLSSSYYNSVSGSYNMPVDNFSLILSSSIGSGYGVYNFSLVESSPQYITNVFGNSATAGNQETYAEGTKIESAYIYNIYPSRISEIVAQPNNWKIFGAAMPSGSTSYSGEPLNFTDANSFNPVAGDSVYSLTNAYTPWILSQQITSWNNGTPTRFNLFQVCTLADGTYVNQEFKVQISNVKLAGTVAGSDWGSFTLTLRAFDDSDRQPVILEQYNNLNLNPEDPNYIARIIGDQYSYINFNGKIITYGIYANQSQYIRIQMSDLNIPENAVPYGFSAYSTPLAGGIGYFIPPMTYTKASIYGIFPGKYPSGVDFSGPPPSADSELLGLYPTSSAEVDCYPDNLNYFGPIPANSNAGQNVIFALDVNYNSHGVGTGSYSSLNGVQVIPAVYDPANESMYVKMRNFVFGFQGGFDGQAPSIDVNVGDNITSGNTQGLNCANSNSAGSIAYTQCINSLSNADQWDINLIATPGIVYSLHSYVNNLVIDMCETRGDVFYILDLYEDGGNPATSQVTDVVGLAAEIDTNYAGAYYPWVRILDTNIDQIVTVPPSVVMPAIYAASDAVGAEWFAVAGLNRGGIPNAVGVTDRVIQSEKDELYNGKVNPIVSFPGEGIVVWGQKTLQNSDSALNRINVRRLLIYIKKFFASTGKYILFEQSVAQTWNKFLAIANPFLEGIQQRNGLYAFQLIMDSSNNTPSLEDQNIMVCQLWIKPTKTAEFFKIPITITTTGASFPTIS